MKKKTNKEIREETRNKVAKEYHATIESLRKRIQKYEDGNKAMRTDYCNVLAENERLKAELQMKDEWIERLADYCNMSEEERNAELVRLNEKKKSDEALNNLLSLYGNVFSKLMP